MKQTWLVAGATLMNLVMFLAFGFWALLRPSIPDTLWLGDGCIGLKTVSNALVWERRPEMEAMFMASLEGSRIDKNNLSFQNTNTTIDVHVEGFLRAKTVTAARVEYADEMRLLRELTRKFSSFGVFEASDCGLQIKLPVNDVPTEL